MQKLTVEWRILDAGHVALVFDSVTWLAFETTAQRRGKDVQAMITEAVVGLLGTAYPVAE
jgi:hypothetical protein